MLRSLIAATGLAAIGGAGYVGFGGSGWVPALIVWLSASFWLLVGVACLAVIRRRVVRLLVMAAVPYLIGVSVVGVGGLLWQVVAHGWARTNAAGFVGWSFVYGLVFFVPVLLVSSWVFGGPPSAGRGFEVVQRSSP